MADSTALILMIILGSLVWALLIILFIVRRKRRIASEQEEREADARAFAVLKEEEKRREDEKKRRAEEDRKQQEEEQKRREERQRKKEEEQKQQAEAARKRLEEEETWKVKWDFTSHLKQEPKYVDLKICVCGKWSFPKQKFCMNCGRSMESCVAVPAPLNILTMPNHSYINNPQTVCKACGADMEEFLYPLPDKIYPKYCPYCGEEGGFYFGIRNR